MNHHRVYRLTGPSKNKTDDREKQRREIKKGRKRKKTEGKEDRRSSVFVSVVPSTERNPCPEPQYSSQHAFDSVHHAL